MSKTAAHGSVAVVLARPVYQSQKMRLPADVHRSRPIRHTHNPPTGDLPKSK